MRIQQQPILHPRSCRRPRSDPTSGYVDPVGKAAALFELDLWHFRITSASAANTVFLGFIPLLPVCIFLDSFLLVCCCRLKIRWAGLLASLCVCWAMGDCCVAVADIAEVVNLRRRQEDTCCERVDGCITPLQEVSDVQDTGTEGCILLSPSRSLHCDPSSGRSPRIPCFGTSRVWRSQSYSRNGTCCMFRHGLGIYIWDGACARLCTENVFGKRLLVLGVILRQFVRWLLRLWFEEHVPEASVSDVVDSFVG
jgi:hypothetical protein